MSFVASLFDIVVHYGNEKRESIIALHSQVELSCSGTHLNSFCQLTAMASTSSFLYFSLKGDAIAFSS